MYHPSVLSHVPLHEDVCRGRASDSGVGRVIRAALLCLGGMIVLGGATARAHHSLAGVYDSRDQATIEGTVVEFQFVNPHPFVVVDVDAGAGAPERWRLELDNRFELVAIGVTADTFARGDRIVATGSRARDGGHGLYVRRLDRQEDGFTYEQVGASPRIRVSPPTTPR